MALGTGIAEIDSTSGSAISITLTFEKGPPIFSPTCPIFPSGLNCLPIAPADEMTEGFCVCLVLSTCQFLRGVKPTHLRAGVLGLPSSLGSIFNSLVGHSTHLHRYGPALGDGDARGDDVSSCETEHVDVSREFGFERGFSSTEGGRFGWNK